MTKPHIARVIPLIALAITPWLAQGQITLNEYHKYWFYRYRLLSEFMVPGTMDSCGTGAGGYHIPAQKSFAPNDYLISYSDETRSIGYYIGLMATEYRLLKNAGWDTSETEKELYYAMKAYERSDARSSYLGIDGGANCQINGYFIRGDVQEPVFNLNPVFEKYKVNGQYSFIAKYKDTHRPGSTPADIRNITPDQVQPLMLGFVLTYKCLEDTDNYNGFYFKEKAAEFADMIASRLDATDWKDINESGQDMGTDRNTHNTFREEGHTYVTAKAASYINHHKDHDDYLTSFTDAGKLLQRQKLLVMYDLMMLEQLKDYVVGHMGAGVAAGNTGHNWAFKTHDFLTEIDAKDQYDYGLYKLAFKYINNEFDHTFDARWHTDLKQAPCYGTQYIPTNMDPAHPYWEGQSPWRAHIKWSGADERDGGGKGGKGSGWDYMIFYNLYNLYYQTTNTSYVGTLPSLPPGLNVTIDEAMTLDQAIKSYNWIKLSSALGVTGDQRLEATQEIKLLPGFVFKAETGKGLTLDVIGPVNACGDVLDEYGELLDPNPMAAQAPPPLLGTQTVQARSREEPMPLKKTNPYKPLEEYLVERNYAVEHPPVRRYEVYPNPFEDKISIVSRDQNTGPGVVLVVDLLGKPISEHRFESLENTLVLPLDPSLPKGVYLVEVNVNQHKETCKIYKK